MSNIITLSGDIGSGKSSTAACLAALTGYDIVSTGKIQRAIAEKRGMTTLELNKISQTDRRVDDEIDAYVIELGKKDASLIIDSRLAWHFIPAAFKVFLAVDSVVGAERVYNASRSDENNQSLEETLANNLKRQALEDQRFQKLYNVWFRRYANYDMVIDTSYTAPECIAERIAQGYAERAEAKDAPRLWLNPKRLLPTRPVGSEDNNAPTDASAPDIIPPIKVCAIGGLFYILDGHQRVISAEREQIDLIPAHLINGSEPRGRGDGASIEQRLNALSRADLIAWEKALGFHLKSYPAREPLRPAR